MIGAIVIVTFLDERWVSKLTALWNTLLTGLKGHDPYVKISKLKIIKKEVECKMKSAALRKWVRRILIPPRAVRVRYESPLKKICLAMYCCFR